MKRVQETRAKLVIGLAALAAMLGMSTANASITYIVNQSIGVGGVTGSITTDGAIGTLRASDIVAWNLHLTGAGGATYNLVNGLSGVEVGNVSDPFNPNAGNNDVTADLHHIYFNYSGTDGGYLGFQELPFYGGQQYWCNASLGQGFDCAIGKSVVPILYSDPTSIYVGATGNQIIASVSTGVPEPSTWAMLVIGFAGFGFVGHRRSMKTASAA